jgi:hypothetical protein
MLFIYTSVVSIRYSLCVEVNILAWPPANMPNKFPL